jgi:hypothetical protein
MIKTSITIREDLGVEQPLFEVDVSLELFKRREDEVRELIEQYYWLPLDPIISAEIKEKVEKLLWKEIITYQRKQKLKQLKDLYIK